MPLVGKGKSDLALPLKNYEPWIDYSGTTDSQLSDLLIQGAPYRNNYYIENDHVEFGESIGTNKILYNSLNYIGN